MERCHFNQNPNRAFHMGETRGQEKQRKYLKKKLEQEKEKDCIIWCTPYYKALLIKTVRCGAEVDKLANGREERFPGQTLENPGTWISQRQHFKQVWKEMPIDGVR